MSVAKSTGAPLIIFCFSFPVTRDLQLSLNTLYLFSPSLCFVIVLKRDLLVYRDDLMTS